MIIKKNICLAFALLTLLGMLSGCSNEDTGTEVSETSMSKISDMQTDITSESKTNNSSELSVRDKLALLADYFNQNKATFTTTRKDCCVTFVNLCDDIAPEMLVQYFDNKAVGTATGIILYDVYTVENNKVNQVFSFGTFGDISSNSRDLKKYKDYNGNELFLLYTSNSHGESISIIDIDDLPYDTEELLNSDDSQYFLNEHMREYVKTFDFDKFDGFVQPMGEGVKRGSIYWLEDDKAAYETAKKELYVALTELDYAHYSTGWVSVDIINTDSLIFGAVKAFT